MIETPRAALLADQIAEVADFFSFGTNDLTQMTFGFSRDDVEGRMMAAYSAKDCSVRTRSKTSTRPVWRARSHCGRARRAARSGPQDRVCGEHGGDPASIDFFARAGLDTSAARRSGCLLRGSQQRTRCSRLTPRRQASFA